WRGGRQRVAPGARCGGEPSGAAAGAGRPPGRWRVRIAIGAALLAAACLATAPFVPGHEAQAMTFFGSGACLLTAGLATIWMWMRRPAHRTVAAGPAALTRLGVRNAARHPVRSLLTAGLLASATF